MVMYLQGVQKVLTSYGVKVQFAMHDLQYILEIDYFKNYIGTTMTPFAMSWHNNTINNNRVFKKGSKSFESIVLIKS